VTARSSDPTRRFSTRVEHYLAYRPSYPEAVFDLLADDCGLSPDWAVADIGSGTGILSQLLLARGNQVFGVEPNAEMRRAAESLLADQARFTSVEGTAEATTLDDDSVDLVVAAQAFHWFQPEAARAEFARILRPAGWVALVWNDRRKTASPFLAAFEELLLEHGTDYRQVDHSRLGVVDIQHFFGTAKIGTAVFDSQQDLDLDGLTGRLLSSSYIPAPGEPGHEATLAHLQAIFEIHQVDGKVVIEYDTRVYFGRLEGSPGPL
jgi:SAM-dependent methyltransferase